MDYLIPLEHFGYVAVFVGSFFGLEAASLLAGYLSADHRYGFALPGSIAAAAAGIFVSNCLLFWLGGHGGRYVDRFPHLTAHAARARRLNARLGIYSVLVAPFIPVLRAPLVVLSGASHIRARKFLPLQVVASIAWGTTHTLLGRVFGAVLPSLTGKNTVIEAAIGAAVVLGILAAYLVHRAHDRKRRRKVTAS